MDAADRDVQDAYSARCRVITVYLSADVDIVMLLSSLCHSEDRIYLKTEARELFLVLGLHVPSRAWFAIPPKSQPELSSLGGHAWAARHVRRTMKEEGSSICQQ